jgi:hypothetical protein
MYCENHITRIPERLGLSNLLLVLNKHMFVNSNGTGVFKIICIQQIFYQFICLLPIRAKNLKEDGQNNTSNESNNDINMTTADGGVKII